MRAFNRRWTQVSLSLLLAGLVAAVFEMAHPSGSSSLYAYASILAATPIIVDYVPSVIPASGVKINLTPMVLMPPTVQPDRVISESEAIAKARTYMGGPLPARAVLANITNPESIPKAGVTIPFHYIVKDVPVWLVTFTLPHPQNWSMDWIPDPGPPLIAQHLNVAVNAHTGDFVVGFLSK